MRAHLAALAVIAGLLSGGCSSASEPRPEPTAPDVPTRLLDASVTQLRFDEGTRNLRAGVTNNSKRDIHVTSATIAWGGFAFPRVRIADDLVERRRKVGGDAALPAAACSREATGRAAMVAVIDGRSRRLPLRVEDPGLLLRLRDKACAAERLDAAATVRLSFEPRTVIVRGEEYLPGRVVLARVLVRTDPIHIVDLGGSVLVDFVPRSGQSGRSRQSGRSDQSGRTGLPVTLTGDRDQVALPVLAGSAHRCDPHARGNSSQTFLLSVYLRLGNAPVQRQILVPSRADQARVLAVIDRDCR